MTANEDIFKVSLIKLNSATVYTGFKIRNPRGASDGLAHIAHARVSVHILVSSKKTTPD